VSAAATLVAFPVAALVIAALLRSSLARRVLVAAPRAERWHTAPTPTFGGVGIMLGVAAGLGAAFAAGAIESSPELVGILAGCGVLFLAGLWDDVRELAPPLKLAAQGIAVALALAGGVRAEVVSNDLLALGLAAFWLLAMTNAFNLLDNMDGLAASLAGIACAYFAIAAVIPLNDNREVLVLSLAVGAACAGFLPFNLRLRRPAAVFMGDAGSQVLGFALAALGMLGSWKEAGTSVATIVLPILVLAVPILDTAVVTLVRLLEGRPISQGGRDHTSHRLVYRGLSEKRAVVLLAVISAALGATSLGYSVIGNGRVAIAGVLVTFAALLQFGTFLGQQGEERRAGGLLVHRRLLAEALVDGAIIGSSFYFSYLLVIEGEGTENQRYVFTFALAAVLAARYVAFVALGLYRAVWRYAGARDAASIVAAVLLGSLGAYAFLRLTMDLRDFPPEIFVVDALLATVLLGCSRFGERALVGALESLRSGEGRRRVLIVGAGATGRAVLRELREEAGTRVVGFVDDDPKLVGRRIQGVPVLGAISSLAAALDRKHPDDAVVALPQTAGETLTRVLETCRAAGVPVEVVRVERVRDAASSLLQTAAE
jgi:UDP-GlcNAc:undecaprenyl-phosphate GlcNAc-1-phosphate transferase